MKVLTKLGYVVDSENEDFEVGQRIPIPDDVEVDFGCPFGETDAKMAAIILLSDKAYSIKRKESLQIEGRNVPDWLYTAPEDVTLAFLHTAYELKSSFIRKANVSVGTPIARLALTDYNQPPQFQALWRRFGVLTKRTVRRDSQRLYVDTSGVAAYKKFRELLDFSDNKLMLKAMAKTDWSAQRDNPGIRGMTDTVVKINYEE